MLYFFDEIFPERRWQIVALPAHAYNAIRMNLPFAFPYTGNKRYTRNVLVRSTIYEGPPLSEEGYAQLEGDIERWNEWREQQAQKSADMTVVDNRPIENSPYIVKIFVFCFV